MCLIEKVNEHMVRIVELHVNYPTLNIKQIAGMYYIDETAVEDILKHYYGPGENGVIITLQSSINDEQKAIPETVSMP